MTQDQIKKKEDKKPGKPSAYSLRRHKLAKDKQPVKIPSLGELQIHDNADDEDDEICWCGDPSCNIGPMEQIRKGRK